MDEPISDPLGAITSLPMLFAFAAKTDGLPMVEYLLDHLDCGREQLQGYAVTFKRLGLVELAALMRSRVRRAKRTPSPPAHKRWLASETR